jgi:hypothetical protein
MQPNCGNNKHNIKLRSSRTMHPNPQNLTFRPIIAAMNDLPRQLFNTRNIQTNKQKTLKQIFISTRATQ